MIPLILFLLLYFFISLIFLFCTKKGKIVKHYRFLLRANIIYIGLLLLSLFALVVLVIIESNFETTIINIDRGHTVLIVSFYSLLGFAVFICNIGILLSNWFSKD